jgi:TetR/AcrR family transcriptional regulator, regulator of cefoperazone and chloramphenicol sensitivity
MLYMRSDKGDLTAKALIRNAALGLFAERGPDAVSVREIAAAAGVSPALVVHHFGSKEGLRAAVDQHVGGIFDGFLAELGNVDWTGEGAGGSLAEMFVAGLPAGSPVPAYLRRLLLSGDPAGMALFERWYLVSRQVVDALVAAGVMRPSADPEVLTAVLAVNDLAALLLRDQLVAVLGIDPLTLTGMTRWAGQVLEVYRNGIFVTEEEQ